LVLVELSWSFAAEGKEFVLEKGLDAGEGEVG
jgi:hypothetical protein